MNETGLQILQVSNSMPTEKITHCKKIMKKSSAVILSFITAQIVGNLNNQQSLITIL